MVVFLSLYVVCYPRICIIFFYRYFVVVVINVLFWVCKERILVVFFSCHYLMVCFFFISLINVGYCKGKQKVYIMQLKHIYILWKYQLIVYFHFCIKSSNICCHALRFDMVDNDIHLYFN